MMRAYLSGTPECKFGLNDKLVLEKKYIRRYPPMFSCSRWLIPLMIDLIGPIERDQTMLSSWMIANSTNVSGWANSIAIGRSALSHPMASLSS